jgi:PIN domain nuclease of toxin-antitoxin system
MAFDNGNIRPAARERFVRAAENNSLHIAAISLFEVAYLAQKKRIELSVPLADWFHLSFSEPSLQICGVDTRDRGGEHAPAAGLSWRSRGPFDCRDGDGTGDGAVHTR